MTDDVFERLAEALDRLPNGFPRTTSRVEIRILEKIFSPEEASLAVQLTGTWEPMKEIALRTGLSADESRRQLMKMARRGMVWCEKREGKYLFRLAPFIVGVYEAQVATIDHELAHLIEDYFSDGGASGLMKLQPSLQRVVPAQGAIKSEWILPYDDVRAILLAAQTFNVHDCICRVQQGLIGEKCDFPVKNCLNFSQRARAPQPGDISQAEALAVLEKSEAVGLVHTVSNVTEGVYYVCNCCGCCCGILRGITDFGIENSVAYANYYAVIEPEFCGGCGNCVERCHVSAISEKDGVFVVDRKRCIGCGLCVTGCPDDAARLERKPDAELIHPPLNFADWEHQRLHSRGGYKK